MSKIDDGGQAFPSDSDEEGCPGMSLRDYFAIQSLPLVSPGLKRAEAAADAYAMADAMLAERAKAQ